jgi:hypothetical protein
MCKILWQSTLVPSMNNEYRPWLHPMALIASLTLKVTHVGRNCSMVAHTNKCGRTICDTCQLTNSFKVWIVGEETNIPRLISWKPYRCHLSPQQHKLQISTKRSSCHYLLSPVLRSLDKMLRPSDAQSTALDRTPHQPTCNPVPRFSPWSADPWTPHSLRPRHRTSICKAPSSIEIFLPADICTNLEKGWRIYWLIGLPGGYATKPRVMSTWLVSLYVRRRDDRCV